MVGIHPTPTGGSYMRTHPTRVPPAALKSATPARMLRLGSLAPITQLADVRMVVADRAVPVHRCTFALDTAFCTDTRNGTEVKSG